MRLRHKVVAAAGAAGSLFGCSQPAPAHRATSSTSATPRAESGSDATVAAEVTTSTEPAMESAAAGTIPPAAAGPTTTVTYTVPTTPRTTTTFAVPEREDEALTDEEWVAKDRGQVASVSWYGSESGTHTANGERYDPSGLTFAHRSMAFDTMVRFCGPLGCVVARCSDRGPAAWTGKTFDLSQAAFARVAPLSAGVATVTWEVIG